MSPSIAEEIARLAEMPSDRLDGLARAVEAELHRGHAAVPSIADRAPASWREPVRRLLTRGLDELGEAAPRVLPVAMRASSLAHGRATDAQRVELVWSGPPEQQSTFRRTDRVWVDLIDGARRTLWLASFSVGSIDRVQSALVGALDRGVDVRVLVERSEDSDGGLDWDGFERFGEALRTRAVFYRWPLDLRARDAAGRAALMHAKALVSDRVSMFVTSANLSSAALERNIEVGVVVRGGREPGWLHDRFGALVEGGVITPFLP